MEHKLVYFVVTMKIMKFIADDAESDECKSKRVFAWEIHVKSTFLATNILGLIGQLVINP